MTFKSGVLHIKSEGILTNLIVLLNLCGYAVTLTAILLFCLMFESGGECGGLMPCRQH